jgi:hypothetical protein
MFEAIQFYKRFIDDLTSPMWATSVSVRHVREWDTDIPKGYVTSEPFNRLMEQFTHEQREAIADLMQDAYDDGIFNALKLLGYAIEDDEMRIVVKGTPLPVMPFGMTFYEDWIGRKSGEYEWPDERSTD